jgi:hypothetical protein
MRQRGFLNIIAELLLELEGVELLVEDLRHVLFPVPDEMLFAGTYGEPKWVDTIYDGMVNAFNSAIETYR